MLPTQQEGVSCGLKAAISMAYPVVISFPECHGGTLNDERPIDDGNKGGCTIESTPFDLVVHV